MPKMKTHKGTIKRIHVTASGKIMRKKRTMGGATRSRTATKRDNRKPVEVVRQDRRMLKRLVPGL